MSPSASSSTSGKGSFLDQFSKMGFKVAVGLGVVGAVLFP